MKDLENTMTSVVTQTNQDMCYLLFQWRWIHVCHSDWRLRHSEVKEHMEQAWINKEEWMFWNYKYSTDKFLLVQQADLWGSDQMF